MLMFVWVIDKVNIFYQTKSLYKLWEVVNWESFYAYSNMSSPKSMLIQ